jgi:protein gp37
MAADTAIEWTDATWPVVKGCDYVSPGCANCYAVDLIHRHAANPNPKISLPLAGLTEVKNGRPRWTGKVYLNEPHLLDPLKWKKGRMVFVPSHGDLFHEDVPDEYIDRVFAVMALAPHHTFQVLTKRAERMQRFMREQTNAHAIRSLEEPGFSVVWPYPNVWLGVSVENQAAADERIPHLLRTPAAVRFLSCEPLLGPVDIIAPMPSEDRVAIDRGHPAEIDWVIVGGESGAGARPCDVEWIRSLVGQCRAARVAVFVKQLGTKPTGRMPTLSGPADDPTTHDPDHLLTIRDKKGGDPTEWPSDLRVREFPTPARRPT